MANMSYCRFRNTRADLEDCLDSLRSLDDLSEEEARAGKNMFDDFLDFCRDVGIILDYDRDAIMDLFDELIDGEEDEDDD